MKTIEVDDFYVENSYIKTREEEEISAINVTGVRLNGYAVIPMEYYIELVQHINPNITKDELVPASSFKRWEELVAITAQERKKEETDE